MRGHQNQKAFQWLSQRSQIQEESESGWNRERIPRQRRHCRRLTLSWTTYLFVELDVGGLEELLDLSAAEVVGELVVRIGHARSVLDRLRVEDGRLGDGVEGHRLVLSVPDLVKMHVRDLLVCDNGRVVRGCVPRQLGEVL